MFELWKLKRRRDKLRRFYDKEVAAYRKRKNISPSQIVQLDVDKYHEMDKAYRDLHMYMGDQVLEQAYRYDVRVPATNDPEFWVVSTDTERGYLTPAGRIHLRRVVLPANLDSQGLGFWYS